MRLLFATVAMFFVAVAAARADVDSCLKYRLEVIGKMSEFRLFEYQGFVKCVGCGPSKASNIAQSFLDLNMRKAIPGGIRSDDWLIFPAHLWIWATERMTCVTFGNCDRDFIARVERDVRSMTCRKP